MKEMWQKLKKSQIKWNDDMTLEVTQSHKQEHFLSFWVQSSLTKEFKRRKLLTKVTEQRK